MEAKIIMNDISNVGIYAMAADAKDICAEPGREPVLTSTSRVCVAQEITRT